ncbi:hypothetical protein [Amycolatopsis saalfeldensis]|uniref:Uncharacterized protein n=1 Tax=Amycolatopsis saalfeldensis TaxID=394193 RepID=A0A1H8U2T3_9PSEU|nr:hypothetical protein [Amycolatopsis saalfeldensis]SEO97366.1 hypothetical protein SAMN04489732_10336 [Amycolatopsis saalfeldensis]
MRSGDQVLRPAAGLATSVEIRGGQAVYEVRTDDPLYRERLRHMGFTPTSAGRFTRRLSATGDIRRTHANFARRLPEMLLQSARRRPVPWREGLEVFLERAEGSRLRWFLYGSGALAVRGIEVGPGDLDFRVDDAQLAGTLLEDLLVEPVTTMTGWIADRGGRAFAGCLLEWIAGVHADVDEPEPHEQGPAAAARLEHVRWQGHDVPVAPLDLQLAVNRRRGLTARVAKIQAHQDRRGT